MGRHSAPPLTKDELEQAKGFGQWEAQHRERFLPSDSRGSRFSTKNLVDLCDQYLRYYRIVSIDGPALATLVRRRRAQKAVATKAKAKRRARKKMRARHRQTKKLLKQKRREARDARQAAERSRQYAFNL